MAEDALKKQEEEEQNTFRPSEFEEEEEDGFRPRGFGEEEDFEPPTLLPERRRTTATVEQPRYFY